MMEVIHFSETSNFTGTTRRNMPEDGFFNEDMFRLLLEPGAPLHQY
jgi:hypothetical protein